MLQLLLVEFEQFLLLIEDLDWGHGLLVHLFHFLLLLIREGVKQDLFRSFDLSAGLPYIVYAAV